MLDIGLRPMIGKSRSLPLTPEARPILLHIQIRCVLHLDLGSNLVLYQVPIVSLYLPVILWPLTRIVLFELPTDIDKLCECVPLVVLRKRLYYYNLMDYLSLGEFLKHLVPSRKLLLGKHIEGKRRAEADRGDNLHYAILGGLLHIVQMVNIAHWFFKLLLRGIISLHLLDLIKGMRL
jgi:hypothetical protein